MKDRDLEKLYEDVMAPAPSPTPVKPSIPAKPSTPRRNPNPFKRPGRKNQPQPKPKAAERLNDSLRQIMSVTLDVLGEG